jgi:hypothetical protein
VSGKRYSRRASRLVASAEFWLARSLYPTASTLTVGGHYKHNEKMATSFIDKNEYGFWARDATVEVMMLSIIQEIDNSYNTIDWLKTYQHHISMQSLPLIYGGMSMELDEFMTSADRIDIFLELIGKIRNRVKKDAEYLSGNNLHKYRVRAMEIMGEYNPKAFKNKLDFKECVDMSGWDKADTSGVIDVYLNAFELLEALLLGEIKFTASSPIDYWKY